METLFSAGEEVEKEGRGDGVTGRRGEWEKGPPLFVPFAPSPRRPVPVYFALMGYSRSKMNSVMNSVRATAEVLAAQ
jgi:hypothetical protein